MPEKLIVRNFGGLDDVELDIGQINILIGPQATGKSICAKLLYYFKGFLHDIFWAAYRGESRRELDGSLLEKFDQFFPPMSWSQGEFLLRYEMGTEHIAVTRSSTARPLAELSYSQGIADEFDRTQRQLAGLRRALPDDGGNRSSHDDREKRLAQRKYTAHISAMLSERSGFLQFFIPAGRSYFTVLQKNIFTFLTTDNALDLFLSMFGTLYEGSKDFIQSGHRARLDKGALLKEVDERTEAILCARYQREDGEDHLVHSDGRTVRVDGASSGQQAMLPLALVLRTLPFMDLNGTGKTIYIEEPEAHLFPTAQRGIVELLTLLFNKANTPLQYIITTHSPYILTSFNNLIHAGALNETLPPAKKAKLAAVVSEDLMLPPGSVRAYALQGGSCEDMICKETGLVSADLLDSVSDELATDFDKLLSVE